MKDVLLTILTIAVAVLLWDWWKRRKAPATSDSPADNEEANIEGDFDAQCEQMIKASGY